MGPLRITPGDLGDRRVVELLGLHLRQCRAETAPGSAHVLDLEGLRAPGISFWTAWEADLLVGTGALQRLSAEHGEVKSMHTAPAARRRGIGRAMLDHLVAVARGQGMTRLSLETGSRDYFKPAHALYLSRGFVDCPPFADYVPDPNSRFLTLDLRAGT